MKITIHRGQNQIGGSIIEIASDTTKIILDAGSELDEEIPVAPDCVFMAEVGILGQVAKVPLIDRRLEEAQRLGFKKGFSASVTKGEKQKLSAMSLVELADLNALALKLR